MRTGGSKDNNVRHRRGSSFQEYLGNDVMIKVQTSGALLAS